MAGTVKLVDEYFSREYRYALGVEEESGAPYVAIPVNTGPVDYEEAYRLDSDQYARLLDDHPAAMQFVNECRRREHDDLLLQAPGWNRGAADDPSPAVPEIQTRPRELIRPRERQYGLACDELSGRRFVVSPIFLRTFDGYYEVDAEVFERLLTDEAAADAYADECRHQRHDDALRFAWRRRVRSSSGPQR